MFVRPPIHEQAYFFEHDETIVFVQHKLNKFTWASLAACLQIFLPTFFGSTMVNNVLGEGLRTFRKL